MENILNSTFFGSSTVHKKNMYLHKKILKNHKQQTNFLVRSKDYKEDYVIFFFQFMYMWTCKEAK